jgi:ribonuclease-3
VLFLRNTQNKPVLENIIYRIRLLFHKEKESYFCLRKILGFYPKQLGYYEEALIHKSFTRKAKKHRNNERLEFLGDAVLDTVIAEYLFLRYPKKREGYLTNTRSKIVQRETLNKIGKEIGLGELIKFSNTTTTHNNYMLGNAFEAFVGAIYLDRGYERCKWFIINKMLKEHIDVEKLAKKEINFKSKLIEWCQKNKYEQQFALVEEHHDSNNNPIFQTQVMIENIPGEQGTGFSKRESQQKAAKETLKKIKKDALFVQAIKTAKETREKKEDTIEIVPLNVSTSES